jgi:EAL domain-containing protein (putative c-di-GMP-specific phosphodiesterase class I)
MRACIKGRFMPLHDLAEHFNELLEQQQNLLRRRPKTYFYWSEGQFFARFGSQNFGNQFIPITEGPDKTIIGYESRLWVRTALGSQIPVDDVFDALVDLDEVVFLDRITRTLQALNFSVLLSGQSAFSRGADHRSMLLSLSVQPRHILGVSSGHGRTFDAILSDCGLAITKVLLHTSIPAEEHFTHFRRALFSYAAFGYRVGIHIGSERDWANYYAWDLTPDYLFLHADMHAPEGVTPKIIRPGERAYELCLSK